MSNQGRQQSPYQDYYEDAYGGGAYQAHGRTGTARRAHDNAAYADNAASAQQAHGNAAGRYAADGAPAAYNGAYGAPGPYDDAYTYDRDQALGRYQAGARKGRLRSKVLKALGAILGLLALALLVFFLWPGSITQGPSYVLLLGSDESIARNNDTSENSLGGVYRTDTMILTRLDPSQRKATLISLPRDTQVQLPGHGTQKLNAAFVFGGLPLVESTVEGLAGVPISHYVMVDMDGLSRLVDALGGVEVDVPITIDDIDAGGHLDAGYQLLNGEQALILCRSRNAFEEAFGNGDAHRAANQRMVIKAIIDKAFASGPITLVSLLPTVMGMVQTDISILDMARLAQAYMGMDASTDLYTAEMPTEPRYEDDLWYQIVLQDEWREMMQRVDAGLPPTADAEAALSSAANGAASDAPTVSVRNGSGYEGVATTAAASIEQAGFSVVDTGNAESFEYASTVVVYNDYAQADAAQSIAVALGAGYALANDGSFAFDTDFLVVLGQDYYAG